MAWRLFKTSDYYERERDLARQDFVRWRGRLPWRLTVFLFESMLSAVGGLVTAFVIELGFWAVNWIKIEGQIHLFNVPNLVAPNMDDFLNYLSQVATGQVLLSESSIFVIGPAVIVFAVFEGMTIRSWYNAHTLFHKRTRVTARFATLKEIDDAYDLIPDRNARYTTDPGQPMAHIHGLSLDFLGVHPLLWVKQLIKTILFLNLEVFPNPYRFLRTMFYEWFLNLNLSDKWENNRLIQYIKLQAPVKGGYTGFYWIDTRPTHGKKIGATRAGKDETMGVPTADINRRSAHPWSFIDTDAKNEDFKTMAKALQEANFDIRLINIADVEQSDSYNPLQIALDYAMYGNIDAAKDEAAKIVQIIGAPESTEGNGGGDIWDGAAQATEQAIILLLLWLAREYDAPEIVTPANIPGLINSLEKFGDNTDNGLTKFFKLLAKLNEENREAGHLDTLINEILLTAGQYLQSTGDTKTSIMFTLQNRIQLFNSEKIARLTSQSTLNVMDVGFPRMLKLHFAPEVYGGLVAVFQLYDLDDQSPHKKPLEEDKIKITLTGSFQYPIQHVFPNHWMIKVHFNDSQNPINFMEHYFKMEGQRRIKRRVGGKKMLDKHSLKPLIKLAITKQLQNLEMEKMEPDLRYSEKPMAIFLITPQDNDNYAGLASLFISQVFAATTSLATGLTHKKLVSPIWYKLNEFSMFPRIPGFNNILTRGLTYGHMMDLYLQTQSQLGLHYSQKEADEIDGNMMNWWQIQTPTKEGESTNDLLSKRLGTVEVQTESVNSQVGPDRQDRGNRQMSVEKVPLMSAKELEEMKPNEMVVLRLASRYTRKGKKVRPWPLFDTEATSMPNAHEFISKTYNLDYYTTDLGIKNKNAHLKYEDLFADFAPYYEDLSKRVEGNTSENNSSELVANADNSDIEKIVQAGQLNHDTQNSSTESYNAIDQADFQEWKNNFVANIDEPFISEAVLQDEQSRLYAEKMVAKVLSQIEPGELTDTQTRVLSVAKSGNWLTSTPSDNDNGFILRLMGNDYEMVWQLMNLVNNVEDDPDGEPISAMNTEDRDYNPFDDSNLYGDDDSEEESEDYWNGLDESTGTTDLNMSQPEIDQSEANSNSTQTQVRRGLSSRNF